MYLTAHRVFSTTRGRQAVNAFRYEHGQQPIAGIDWENPNIALIAEAHPGALVGDNVEMAPGGNEVISYLDVAAQDGTPNNRITDALRGFRQRIKPHTKTMHTTVDAIAMQFWVSAGLEGQELDEFDELSSRAIALLDRRGSPWRALPPLIAVVRLEPDGFTCSLDPESAKRAEASLGFALPAERVTVSREVESGIQTVIDDLMPELAHILTRLSADKMLALGGVRFVTAEGRTLGEWPARGADQQQISP